VQCALLNQLVLPLLSAAHDAGCAGEVLSTECLEVLSSVFRVSDTHSVLFGEQRSCKGGNARVLLHDLQVFPFA
jgi:hypothetical protein